MAREESGGMSRLVKKLVAGDADSLYVCDGWEDIAGREVEEKWFGG